jgi:hypothetical protein
VTHVQSSTWIKAYILSSAIFLEWKMAFFHCINLLAFAEGSLMHSLLHSLWTLLCFIFFHSTDVQLTQHSSSLSHYLSLLISHSLFFSPSTHPSSHLFIHLPFYFSTYLSSINHPFLIFNILQANSRMLFFFHRFPSGNHNSAQ